MYSFNLISENLRTSPKFTSEEKQINDLLHPGETFLSVN